MVTTLIRYVADKDLAISTIGVKRSADLDAAFAEMSKQAPGALFVLTDNILQSLAEPVVAKAMAQRVPTFAISVFMPHAGALFDYSRDPPEAFRGVARLLKKILGGAPVAELRSSSRPNSISSSISRLRKRLISPSPPRC